MVKRAVCLIAACLALAGCAGQTLPARQYSMDDLRPELRANIEKTPPAYFDEEGLKAVRAETDALVGSSGLPSDPAVNVNDLYIPNPGAGGELRLRVYEPAGREGVLPAVFWIHGGGMVISHPEGDEAQCIRFAKEINCVVVAPDYRLAPEHPYPAGPDDCYAALEWLAENAGELGVDPTRIAVAGASAGGGLSISTALRARDENGPKIAFLMPIYPMINEKLDTPSGRATYAAEIDGRILTADAVRHMWRYYLGDAKGKVPKYAAPVHETDWSGLPPVYTCVGDIDPFRDDTVWLAEQLTAAGNTPEFHLLPGCPHAFDNSDPGAPVSVYMVGEWVRVLKEALWQ